MGTSRARTAEQKARQHEALLAAAVQCVDLNGHDVTLSAVARAAGMAKSALYRYVGSVEQLLLELLLREESRWVGRLELVLLALAGSGDVGRVAEHVSQLLAREPRWCQLNVARGRWLCGAGLSDEAAVALETRALGTSLRVANVLVAALPGLDHASALRAHRLLLASAASLWCDSHPSEAVRRARATPPLTARALAFERELRLSWQAALAGLLALARRGADATAAS